MVVEPFTPSRLSVVLNDVPGSVKSFNTLNYEGSQARVVSKPWRQSIF